MFKYYYTFCVCIYCLLFIQSIHTIQFSTSYTHTHTHTDIDSYIIMIIIIIKITYNIEFLFPNMKNKIINLLYNNAVIQSSVLLFDIMICTL